MSLLAKKTGEDFNYEICPPGNHIAICFSVVDMGVQEVEYQGEKSLKRKVRISWEIPDEIMKEGENEGKPFSISKTYTLSLSDKANLKADLTSWRGRPFTESELAGFDLFNVLDAPCMLNVTHILSRDGQKTYAGISSIAQLPKGTSKPARTNDLRQFSIDAYNQNDWDSLPEWLKEKINFNPEVINSKPQETYSEFKDDDIPF